jgi:hypothetical protein
MSEFKTNKISPRKGTTQTIGDSGDTLSIASGVTVTNAGTITTAGISGGTINNSGGTISGLAGVVEWDTTAKTTAFTAEANKGYFCNTTSAAFTVTLPASPTAGDVIAIKDYANTFDTNNLTLNANGNKIQGSTTNFDITVEGANSQFIYVDATRGWVLTDASKASDISENLTYITATGGTITCCGDYKIHTFTGPGTFTVCSVGNCAAGPAGNTVDYLVVAGGASGGFGDIAGGGGAGGFRLSNSTGMPSPLTSPLANPTGLPVSVQGYPITVGGGGSPVVSSPGIGNSGSNSVFSTITSAGGGGGGGNTIPLAPGQPGGSGGGASYRCGTGGSGNTPPVSPPQGNNGGNSSSTPGSPAWGQGGGGGAGSVGANGTSSAGGDGGDGSYVVASGFGGCNGTPGTVCGARYFSGGGGSSVECGSSASGGIGGEGGGGNGFTKSPTTACATSGSANTGGGGGGGERACTNHASGSGGSGIVIIRYKYQ